MLAFIEVALLLSGFGRREVAPTYFKGVVQHSGKFTYCHTPCSHMNEYISFNFFGCWIV